MKSPKTLSRDYSGFVFNHYKKHLISNLDTTHLSNSVDINSLLRPEVIQSIAGLELIARVVSDERSAGLHKSTQLGHGQEFSQYRSYEPGDDLRSLDWKMFARSDRYFVRLAEIENRVNIRFIIDASASMEHQYEGLSKIDYVKVLVASIAWLSQRFNDKLALEIWNSVRVSQLKGQAGPQHFRKFLHELISLKTQGNWPHQEESIRLQGEKELMILFTDLHQHQDEIMRWALANKIPANELIVFRILAKDEIQPPTNARWLEDLESHQTIAVSGKRMAKWAAQKLEDENKSFRTTLEHKEIAFELVSTADNPAQVLYRFLKHRKQL